MQLGIRLYTLFNGQKIGEDAYGNAYYWNRFPKHERGQRRWVIFKGQEEATKVPPEWHGWLRKAIDEVPDNKQKYKWQQQHEPNLTGTPYAYRPPGHFLKGGKRDKATGDYEAWTPKKSKAS